MPTALSESTWAAIGVGVAAAIAVAGWLGAWLQRLLRERPRIVFNPLQFHGPDERVRPNYRHAAGFRIRNLGGTALNVAVALADPDEAPNYSEVVTRPAITRDEFMTDFMGMRGAEPGDDLSDDEARAFFERGILIVICSDERGRNYLFFPGGPSKGAVLKIDPEELPWSSPEEMFRYLFQFPSRGERPLSEGRGRF